ncbi:bifunctional tRNA (5-methylaminomethyl-2-thiouridine)(34)-methyltransferase MnmD/FAD-dependent 5-carboxymethylaminomethyl-2-thiouridine(34) oxidoreductase MnmC [Jeongeupia naejangsanensis]|uniref:tRNA 5-methylaminomethyl-2-thiouridine biosynthesis bifunctional protein MnmC n=1 Tax=Jeongeupia naejangsanensis TaxID=613195 RepID=A0ABS2BFE1_9NEIS|nr:bifunctional tRNA (5-methylaminomethyl-2-thiouridine)(34)-methyltransferase MnmD/FAD-dependent 5-carboxymethylaminomethyl-2-thiouridine(34) oxidoreductase MnmC [Jeongeupia naejangsanensis]MBM3114316.1 bifunctional tRNA (5-methylaminomethyl-2-thiouridine)(34)-methyltransferase MnmD/FAD-dependent 5-carboxymethylaminomethyl-2-thiouridine(34) oxidoreductase MnmC [Jeongeupia naejangsanensis]
MARPTLIVPARLAFNEHGIPYSATFDDAYHSPDGGIGQAEHVFLRGNDLPDRWRGRDVFTIVETGFGQGLSFLVTWAAWRADPDACKRLHFVSVELHPFSRDDLTTLLARYPQYATLAAELLAQWPALTPGFHRLWLDDGRVTLTLMFGDVLDVLPQLDARADAIYLDGFSPSKNPDLWTPTVFKQLWRLCHADTTLATYTAAGAVRRALNDAGFAVEKAKGYGSKWQMLRGRLARAPRTPAPSGKAKHAMVIGAGLAGCAVAERLAARGWRIDIVDTAVEPATQSSGNLAGLMHAYVSQDDNLLARLSRAGNAATLALLRQLADAGLSVPHKVGGILQVARNAEQEALQRQIADSGNWPGLAFLPPDEAEQRLGHRPLRGGWWFEQGAWINPPGYCRALLARHGDRVRFRGNTTVATLEVDETGIWRAFDGEKRLVAEAPIVILANASAARALAPAADLPLWSVARVASHLPASAIGLNAAGIAGAGYLTGELDGERIIGAAAFNGDLAAAEAENRNALAALLPELALPPDTALRNRVCQRPTSPDRLPLVGELAQPWHDAYPRCHQLAQIPRQTGLYGALALGARGLSWSALIGEILACQLNGEPAPVEIALLRAIDPARFLLRALRRGEAYQPTLGGDDDE